MELLMLFSQLAVVAIIGMGVFTLSENRKPEPATSGAVLLVANKADRSLGVIDPELGREVATISENAVTGHEVAASPDGSTAYIPIYGNSGVGKAGSDGRSMLVVDLKGRKIVSNIDFGHGVRPHCPIFDSVNHVLYVTTELDNSVAIIDPQSFKIVGSIPTERPESHMLAIDHSGKRGYAANVGSGTVSVLDLQARKVIQVIPIAAQVQRISISPDDRLVFTADQTKPQLAVIDTATNKLKTWVPLPSVGYGTASSPDGRWLVVALPAAKKAAIVDLSTMQVVRTVDVPASPQAVLIPPDGRVAYISCDAEHKIVVLRMADWTVEKMIDTGNGADGLAWAPRP
jgi:YVTN family beta-propeller protein